MTISGRRPEWDIDRAYGEVAEGSVRALLDDPRVEVKRKRAVDLCFYVETECLFGGEYRRSGIQETKAPYWAFVIAETGIVVLLPTDAIRRALPTAPAAHCTEGQYPTRGKLVNLGAVLYQSRKERP